MALLPNGFEPHSAIETIMGGFEKSEEGTDKLKDTTPQAEEYSS